MLEKCFVHQVIDLNNESFQLFTEQFWAATVNFII